MAKRTDKRNNARVGMGAVHRPAKKLDDEVAQPPTGGKYDGGPEQARQGLLQPGKKLCPQILQTDSLLLVNSLE